LKAAKLACEIMKDAKRNKLLTLNASESKWLNRLENIVATAPETATELETQIMKTWGQSFLPREYGLPDS